MLDIKYEMQSSMKRSFHIKHVIYIIIITAVAIHVCALVPVTLNEVVPFSWWKRRTCLPGLHDIFKVRWLHNRPALS